MRSKINKRYGGSIGGKQTKRKSHKYLGKKHRATKRAYRRRHKRVKSIRAKSRRGERGGGVSRRKKRTDARRSVAAARAGAEAVTARAAQIDRMEKLADAMQFASPPPTGPTELQIRLAVSNFLSQSKNLDPTEKLILKQKVLKDLKSSIQYDSDDE